MNGAVFIRTIIIAVSYLASVNVVFSQGYEPDIPAEGPVSSPGCQDIEVISVFKERGISGAGRGFPAIFLSDCEIMGHETALLKWRLSATQSRGMLPQVNLIY